MDTPDIIGSMPARMDLAYRRIAEIRQLEQHKALSPQVQEALAQEHEKLRKVVNPTWR